MRPSEVFSRYTVLKFADRMPRDATSWMRTHGSRSFPRPELTLASERDPRVHTLALTATDVLSRSESVSEEAQVVAVELPPAVEVEPEASREDYSTWTKSELYNLARGLDVRGRSRLNKAQLLRAIQRHLG